MSHQGPRARSGGSGEGKEIMDEKALKRFIEEIRSLRVEAIKEWEESPIGSMRAQYLLGRITVLALVEEKVAWVTY